MWAVARRRADFQSGSELDRVGVMSHMRRWIHRAGYQVHACRGLPLTYTENTDAEDVRDAGGHDRTRPTPSSERNHTTMSRENRETIRDDHNANADNICNLWRTLAWERQRGRRDRMLWSTLCCMVSTPVLPMSWQGEQCVPIDSRAGEMRAWLRGVNEERKVLARRNSALPA